MADRRVERREQELMRRREHDQKAALAKMPRRALEFGAVVRDMLQHINIKNAVEDFGVGEIGYRAHPDLALVSYEIAALPPYDLLCQLRIRFQSDPALLAWTAQQL